MTVVYSPKRSTIGRIHIKCNPHRWHVLNCCSSRDNTEFPKQLRILKRKKRRQKPCHSPARLWQTLCVYSMCCSAIRKTSYELVRVNSFSSPMYHSPSHSLQAPHRHHQQDQPTMFPDYTDISNTIVKINSPSFSSKTN